MILFLDFDGVLHPDAAFLVNGRPTLKAEGQLFMWAPLLIKVLDDFPEVEIVLSTSWVRELSYTRACLWLPVELRRRVIGATWHSGMSFKKDGFRSLPTWYDEASRYQQIKRYARRAGLSEWVAIDDQPEGWNEDDLDKLVHTIGDTGLSDPAALALLAERLEVRLERRPESSTQLKGMFAGKVSKPISIVAMNKAIGIAAASGGQCDKTDDLDALPGIPPS